MLYDITIEQEEVKEVVNLDNPFSGKKVYATGTFENYKKNQLKEAIEFLGGIFKYSKSSLDILVVGSKKGSSKVKEAESIGATIMSENEFTKLVEEIMK